MQIEQLNDSSWIDPDSIDWSEIEENEWDLGVVGKDSEGFFIESGFYALNRGTTLDAAISEFIFKNQEWAELSNKTIKVGKIVKGPNYDQKDKILEKGERVENIAEVKIIYIDKA